MVLNSQNKICLVGRPRGLGWGSTCAFSRIWLFGAPWTVARQAPCPWDSPGKDTGAGCHALLQGIFLTQGSNPGLLHCRWILCHWATREWGRLWYEFQNIQGISVSLDLQVSVYHPGSLLSNNLKRIIWLCRVFVAAHRIFSCDVRTLSYSTWGLVLWPGIKLWSSALGAWSLSHWATREVPWLTMLTSEFAVPRRLGWVWNCTLKSAVTLTHRLPPHQQEQSPYPWQRGRVPFLWEIPQSLTQDTWHLSSLTEPMAP